MYHAKIWDEDKLNITSSYGSSKYGNIFAADSGKSDDKHYNEQKYGSSEEGASSDYVRNKKNSEKDEDKKKDAFEELTEKEKAPEIKEEEDIKFAAARQVFQEMKRPSKTEHKKNINSIEDAIKKAIDSEKKVIVMDN
ncbi:MAG: hypothetical protein AABX00_06730 [Nanoarchaeota archaeon]